jgi:twitching motility two-component system response regulator PilG
MLTSKDGLFDRARGKLAGCDDYLVKPFTREALIGVIDRHVRPPAQDGETAER